MSKNVHRERTFRLSERNIVSSKIVVISCMVNKLQPAAIPNSIDIVIDKTLFNCQFKLHSTILYIPQMTQ